MVQVKNFFVNYRRRFNIDEVLQEWEAEHGKEEMNGNNAQKPVKSPDNTIKVSEEEDEVLYFCLLVGCLPRLIVITDTINTTCQENNILKS